MIAQKCERIHGDWWKWELRRFCLCAIKDRCSKKTTQDVFQLVSYGNARLLCTCSKENQNNCRTVS